jgi:hypothetical protein
MTRSVADLTANKHSIGGQIAWTTSTVDGLFRRVQAEVLPGSEYKIFSSMIVSAMAEIHFHQQEQASVYMESTGSGNCEIVSEIGLLTVLAIRVFSNLGDDACSSKLAEFLLFLSESLASTAGTDLGLIEVIPYPGYQGRMLFVATMELTDDTFKGNVTSTGFDTVMTGYSYYGPISVLAFV